MDLMHREFNPAQMAFGHTVAPSGDHHHHDHQHHEHDHEAELRTLVATTLVVGLLLGADVVLGLLGWGDAYRRPLGIPLALAAAVIGGGRVVYLALAALLEGRIGADIALAVACV